MRLRRVDIQGFKSFRDRQTVELADGMTAIVGPNGCGKSNVVDAIKWAMGDMSPKSLRGQSMTDVIFAGSEQRKPAGFAEVTMTFENDGDGPIGDDIEWGDELPSGLRDAAEISVTRRLHRSGDSEYLINKTPCRLMDIQNLLAGTGVGKSGYSIIEQNRVGFIVQAKPEQRRMLIEEASGITRYKNQRDRAEKRLERTEENLLRVEDVRSEVEKQIRTLERQAKKAAQHRALMEELRALELAILVARRDELQSERELLAEQGEVADKEIELARAAMEGANAEHDKLRVDAFQAEKAHANATESFYRVDTKLNLARSRVEHATVSLQEANRRLGSSEKESAVQKSRIDELTEELAKVEAELEVLGDLAGPESELVDAEATLREAREKADVARKEREDARRALEKAKSEMGRRQERKDFFVRRRAELQMRESALQSAVAEAEDEKEDAAEKVETLGAEVGVLRKRLEESSAREKQFESKLSELRSTAQQAEVAARKARAQLHEVEVKVESLETLLSRGEGLSDALKRVLDAATGREGFHGTLADHLVVEEGREQVAANLLEGRMLDVLVDDLALAEALLDELQKKGVELQGRVSFRATGGEEPESVARAALEEIAAVDAESSDGRVRVAKNRLVAGTTSTQSVLEQRRRLVQLKASQEETSRVVQAATEAAEKSETELRAAIQKGELARRESETLRLELRTREQDLSAADRELERIKRAANQARSEIVPVLKAQQELDDEEAENTRRLAELAEEKSGAQDRLTEVGESDADVQDELEVLRGIVTEKKIAVASARERRRNLVSTKERTARSIESARELLEKYVTESGQMSERITELQTTIELGESELTGAQEKRDGSKKEMEDARKALEAANASVAELETKMRDKRAKIERKVEARQELEFRQREASLGITHIDEQLRERFETTESEARTLIEKLETKPAERRGKRDYLRKRIESLGPVNAMAEEEYEQAKERSTFLEEQKADLEAAIADLRQAIARMDRESRRRFKETFEVVNAKFKEIFPRLFRGGRAELILTEPDDLLNTGVDIVVQPPGKKLQSMTLLSGGEKALTAVSLIFSIFLLKPTPFSILDEVDAPLDEANVGRFARMVHELSGTSQMIVITHSRRTMEASDVLYGVTMEEPGVSKLVNVRLSEIDERLAS